MPPPPMIAGLYPYTRGGVEHPPTVTLTEIPRSLEINPSYSERLIVLAGDRSSAGALAGFGLQVHRVFGDAPAAVRHDMAHRMKHWMCLWALREFGEFLWVDWDTVWLRDPSDAFWDRIRATATPRFIRIPGYWATVNCGIYFATAAWAPAMEASLFADVPEPNDELLWRTVLPGDVLERQEFWWDDAFVHVQDEQFAIGVSPETFAAHVGDLGVASALTARSASVQPT